MCHSAGVMYWGDVDGTGIDRIETAYLNGTGRRTLLAESAHYFAFAFHDGNIYFTDWSREYVCLLRRWRSWQANDITLLLTFFSSVNQISDFSSLKVEDVYRQHYKYFSTNFGSITVISVIIILYSVKLCSIILHNILRRKTSLFFIHLAHQVQLQ